MSDQAKLENKPDAPNAPAAPTLPFGGKFAAVLLLLVAAAAVVLAVMKVSCCWKVGEIPPWSCWWPDSTPNVQRAETAVFIAGCVVLLWLTVSVAVFVWRWAHDLPFGGKWAIVSLAAIVVGESAITEFWQGYVNSFGKVTDKLVWILLLWFVVAWRGKSMTEWVKKSVKAATEEHINAVKGAVKDAAQTMKATADDIAKELHDTAEAVKSTAENTAEGFKNMSKRAYTAAGEGATAAVNVATDTVTAAGKTIADIPNQALSAIKGSRSEDGEQAQDSTPEHEKDAAEKPAEENTQTEEKGFIDGLKERILPDKKDKDKGGD